MNYKKVPEKVGLFFADNENEPFSPAFAGSKRLIRLAAGETSNKKNGLANPTKNRKALPQ